MSNRQPVLPFKVLCILLYGSQSWLERLPPSPESRLVVRARTAKLAHAVRKRKEDLYPMLEWLTQTQMLLGWSRPAPGIVEVRLRPLLDNGV